MSFDWHKKKKYPKTEEEIKKEIEDVRRHIRTLEHKCDELLKQWTEGNTDVTKQIEEMTNTIFKLNSRLNKLYGRLLSIKFARELKKIYG